MTLSTLNGRKTHIVSLATVAYAFAHAHGLIHVSPEVAYPVFAGLGLAALRHSIGPSKAASSTVKIPGSAVALALCLSLSMLLVGCKNGQLQKPDPNAEPAFAATGGTIGALGGPGGAVIGSAIGDAVFWLLTSIGTVGTAVVAAKGQGN